MTVRERRVALENIRSFTTWLTWFTFIISTPFFGLGVASMVARPAELAILATGLGAYGLVCAMGLAFAGRGLTLGKPDSLRWTRWALYAAVPGSLIVGLTGVAASAIGFLGIVDGEGGFPALILSIGVVLSATGLGNIAALVRLFRNDLDELLWYDVRASLDVGLNHLEEEQEI